MNAEGRNLEGRKEFGGKKGGNLEGRRLVSWLVCLCGVFVCVFFFLPQTIQQGYREVPLRKLKEGIFPSTFLFLFCFFQSCLFFLLTFKIKTIWHIQAKFKDDLLYPKNYTLFLSKQEERKKFPMMQLLTVLQQNWSVYVIDCV